jgi:hypothetical protein
MTLPKSTLPTADVVNAIEQLRGVTRKAVNVFPPIPMALKSDLEIAIDKVERSWKAIEEHRRLAENPPEPTPAVRLAGAKN